jgi:pyruvate formate lyase activating enzyme
MNIRGIDKTSLIDFPGKICTVLFCGGCNLMCGFCHNPDLVRNSPELTRISNDEALTFLTKRRRLIDGVTLSGGEPTLAKSFVPFISDIKTLSLQVKLDTNGLNPNVVENCIHEGLLDYVALDIKTSPSKYRQITGVQVDFSRILATLAILKTSGIDYELRTTCVPGYAEPDDFREIIQSVGNVKRYFLQQFISRVPLLDES